MKSPSEHSCIWTCCANAQKVRRFTTNNLFPSWFKKNHHVFSFTGLFTYFVKSLMDSHKRIKYKNIRDFRKKQINVYVHNHLTRNQFNRPSIYECIFLSISVLDSRILRASYVWIFYILEMKNHYHNRLFQSLCWQ